jgi:diguanylate cyclase (GGDEF)-like protein
MMWVVLLDILTLALNMILLPRAVALSMLLPASVLPPAAIAVHFAWQKPYPSWAQGAALLTGMFFILLSVSMVGESAGGEFHERYLTIMLFVATTAIIIFGIPLWWTISIAAMALGLYLAFQLRNPGLDFWSAISGVLFFASGIIATVIARRTINILAQKTFLLEIRDRVRVTALAEANSQLEQLARTDPLTGVANRRWMSEILQRLWNGPAESLPGTAMLMCDIDYFKALNDRLGHAEGDRSLVQVASIIKGCIRRDRDHVARYGGEEFLVLLPDIDERGALAAAERIRQGVEAAGLLNPGSRVTDHVTVSVGVAVRMRDALGLSPEQLQRQADIALYRAKQAGRNRVALYGADAE